MNLVYFLAYLFGTKVTEGAVARSTAAHGALRVHTGPTSTSTPTPLAAM